METDRHDQRAASATRGQDERTAWAVSMRPDLVLGGSSQLSATSSAPGGIGTRGQAFDGGTMAVLAATPTLLPGIGIDDLAAASAMPGDAVYLRCGGCGATIALQRSVRHDGQLVDYAPDSHDTCGALVAFGSAWGTDG
jgi:hypothetical protein